MKKFIICLVFFQLKCAEQQPNLFNGFDLNPIKCKQADIKVEAECEINLTQKNVCLKLADQELYIIGRNFKDKAYYAWSTNGNYYNCNDNRICYKLGPHLRRRIVIEPEYYQELKNLYEQALAKAYFK